MNAENIADIEEGLYDSFSSRIRREPPPSKKYKVAFEYHFSDFDRVVWNGAHWYCNTFSEIRRLITSYDKYCKIKIAEIRLARSRETVEIWHFDTTTELGNLVIKEVVK